MTGGRAGALVLAAGRGERMRPLTDHTPKPLLHVRGRPLLAWHLDALAHAGVRHAVINTAWLGEQILNQIGLQRLSGNDLLLSISYSQEGDDFGYALETAGGIVRALPLLADVFWLVAGDVHVPQFAFDAAALARFAAGDALAHLWLVPNPTHHPAGDFTIDAAGCARNPRPGDATLTYSTIGLFRHALFAPPYCDLPPGNPQGIAAPLAPLLRAAMDHGRVTAETYPGSWTDVGTPARLAALQ